MEYEKEVLFTETEAQEIVTEYKALAKKDERWDRAYRLGEAVLSGKPVININKVIVGGGVSPNTKRPYPALAIARADSKVVSCEGLSGENRVTFRGEGWSMDTASKEAFEGAPASEDGGRLMFSMLWGGSSSAQAKVPMVPARVLPRKNSRLDKLWVLWEATWTEVPPDDPLLLKRIDDIHFEVLAQWNLTPLEKLVLSV